MVQLIYPDQGLIVWIVPGDANSTLQESNPVVAVLYLDVKQLKGLLTTADLRGWNGYQSYKSYLTATSVRTAIPSTFVPMITPVGTAASSQ